MSYGQVTDTQDALPALKNSHKFHTGEIREAYGFWRETYYRGLQYRHGTSRITQTVKVSSSWLTSWSVAQDQVTTMENWSLAGMDNAKLSNVEARIARCSKRRRQKIQSCSEPLDAQAVGNALYGLRLFSSIQAV